MRGSLAVATSILSLLSAPQGTAYVIESGNGFLGHPIEGLVQILNDDSRTGAWTNVVLAMGKSEAKAQTEKTLLEFIRRPEPILAKQKPWIANEVLSGKRYAVIALGGVNTPPAIEFLRKMMDRKFAANAIAAWSHDPYYVDDDPASLLMGAAAYGLVISHDSENEKIVRDMYTAVKEQLTNEISTPQLTPTEVSELIAFFSHLLDAMVRIDVYHDGKEGCCGGYEFLNLLMDYLSKNYTPDLDMLDRLNEQIAKRKAD